MRQSALLALGCVLVSANHGAWAQAPRVVVVREDDGSLDEPRGHVSNPNTVLKKVLAVEYEAREIRSARVMYRMKVHPYHVGTRQLYGGPVEGIEWNNLVIHVNGQEVLRDSLVVHATAGWHEVEVPTAVLKLGDNEITFGLDRPGGYFYMAVDNSAPLPSWSTIPRQRACSPSTCPTRARTIRGGRLAAAT